MFGHSLLSLSLSVWNFSPGITVMANWPLKAIHLSTHLELFVIPTVCKERVGRQRQERFCFLSCYCCCWYHYVFNAQLLLDRYSRGPRFQGVGEGGWLGGGVGGGGCMPNASLSPPDGVSSPAYFSDFLTVYTPSRYLRSSADTPIKQG